MVSSLGALLGVPMMVIRNILNIFHAKDVFDNKLRKIKTGADVRLEAIINLAKFGHEDNHDLPAQIRAFGQNIILYEEFANQTHYSINKTTKIS